MGRRIPFPGLTALAVAVLLLLPALAWLQYSWLNQIAEADRERRQRTLETAAQQLAHELEAELARAFFSLQIDPSIVESQAWSAYAQRYESWAGGAVHAGIVEHVFLAAADEHGGPGTDLPLLRVWRPERDTFEEVPWPADLEPVRARFIQQVTHVEVRGGAGEARTERIMMPPVTLGDSRTLVAPIMRVRVAEGGEPGRRPGPADVRFLGFTLIRLDLDAVKQTLLPDLVVRHFDARGDNAEFRVAIVERGRPDAVVYESEPGAAATASASPDAEAPLLSTRNNALFFVRGAGGARRGERRPPPPPQPGGAATPGGDRVMVGVVERGGRPDNGFQARMFDAGDARWRLVVKHRAGSLEAAVAAARLRSLGLSSGILALLGAAIGLIVVSARRAGQLAAQQVEFVAAVSHELRTPVSVIGAAAGNLADGIVGDPARVRTYGATIQAEARRLGETVERVLQLAGIMAGRRTAPETLAVSSLVDDALAACRAEIDGAGVAVERAVPADLPPIAGDGAALRSALQNLVSNAIKYGGEARWLRVSARADAPGGRARTVEIAVEDHGIGIAADDKRHIFEPFYRGKEAVARQIQGSGLGLNLVHRIAQAHGGSVAVVSEPGRGSTFTLRLPAAEGAPVVDVADAARFAVEPGGQGVSPGRG
ncbi:MAG: HAMP domain-containing sensor histidine kinase [Acidobacteriota bacterium]